MEDGKAADVSSLDYQPQAGETIFHYCPASSFWAIWNSRSLWLASVYTLNDATELTWGRGIVSKVLEEHPNEFSSDFRLFMSRALVEPDAHVLPLIASFSREADLLSQWRAYATDGTGFVLEVDASRLTSSMPVSMKQVLYESKHQEMLVLTSLRVFNAYWKMGESRAILAMREVLPHFAVDLVSFKHPSFFEEREVRAVHLVTRNGSWWDDPGGHTAEQDSVNGVMVEKRKRGDLEIPYVSMPMPHPIPISGIILGPKNNLSIEDVCDALAEIGFSNLRVRRSSCPYR